MICSHLASRSRALEMPLPPPPGFVVKSDGRGCCCCGVSLSPPKSDDGWKVVFFCGVSLLFS